MRRIGVVIFVSVMAVAAFAGPAGADGGVDGCALVTKKEASKLLGAKVVSTENLVDETTGGQTCTYTTNKHATATSRSSSTTPPWQPFAIRTS